jgi:magnesium-transporting ATPase (P-type)
MTTSEEHNKKLAYSHLGYAAFQLLMMFVMIVVSIIIFAGLAVGDEKGEFPVALVATIFIISSLFQLLFTVPSIVAGFGLLKRKRWAKTAAIIAGVLCAMSFPIGIAVCVYTFWFLFGEHGKALYDSPLAETGRRSDYFLNEPSNANTVGNWTERKREYVPPKEMPNWRE